MDERRVLLKEISKSIKISTYLKKCGIRGDHYYKWLSGTSYVSKEKLDLLINTIMADYMIYKEKWEKIKKGVV